MLQLPLAVLLLALPEAAPISEVTVYSDRARVTRVAKVSPGEPVDLPLLPQGIDPSTVRVEATGAEVRRVELTLVGAEELPLDEGRKLLASLDTLTDELTRLTSERDAVRAQTEALRRLKPEPARDEPLKPAARLDASGWSSSVEFVDSQLARREERAHALDEQVREKERERQLLAEKARLFGAVRRSGYRVRVTLAGSGVATIKLTYQIAPARWLPNYDVQLVPEAAKVQIAFSGLVSQETGEDWSEAQLTLSTAVPATSAQLPRLATWKIGQKDRFIPTPAQVIEPVRPAPPAVAPLPEPDLERELRTQLLSAASGIAAPERYGAQASADEAQPMAPPMIDSGAATYGAIPSAMPPPPPPMPMRRPSPAPSRSRGGRNAPAAPAMQPAPEMEMKEEVAVAGKRASRDEEGSYQVDGVNVDNTAGSLAPPPRYFAPVYAPELPASAAGGYDLSYRSLRPETIQSGHGQRRVALFTESWPVTVERRVFPALAQEAFLVAQLKSPAKQLLPSGPATLFVGADPAGNAQFKRVAPNESFALPLGLDRAIKPVRNVALVEAERGFIGRDELNTYVVTDELANPYPVPITLRIYDQMPLTDDKDVEVKFLGAQPWALEDKVKGSLEWDLTVAPGKKAVVSFRYTIKRPKGWRMHQSQ